MLIRFALSTVAASYPVPALIEEQDLQVFVDYRRKPLAAVRDVQIQTGLHAAIGSFVGCIGRWALLELGSGEAVCQTNLTAL